MNTENNGPQNSPMEIEQLERKVRAVADLRKIYPPTAASLSKTVVDIKEKSQSSLAPLPFEELKRVSRREILHSPMEFETLSKVGEALPQKVVGAVPVSPENLPFHDNKITAPGAPKPMPLEKLQAAATLRNI